MAKKRVALYLRLSKDESTTDSQKQLSENRPSHDGYGARRVAMRITVAAILALSLPEPRWSQAACYWAADFVCIQKPRPSPGLPQLYDSADGSFSQVALALPSHSR